MSEKTREEIIGKAFTESKEFKPYSIGRICFLTEERPNALFVEGAVKWKDVGEAYIVFTRTLQECYQIEDWENEWKNDDGLTTEVGNRLVEYIVSRRLSVNAAQTEDVAPGKQ